MKMKKEKTFVAYSKKLCNYARYECWAITIVYIILLVVFDKDISPICLASWGAYGVARAFYYNMAKSDHQIQLLGAIDKNDKVKEIIEDKIENDFIETINESISSD